MRTEAAFTRAFERAASGFDWSRPCLIWLSDYVRDVTGKDPAAAWRAGVHNKRSALVALKQAARGGKGDTHCERALVAAGQRLGWRETDAPAAGAVGVFNGTDGTGYPAIADPAGNWLLATESGALVIPDRPRRMWSIS
jgi:hypothetical protein